MQRGRSRWSLERVVSEIRALQAGGEGTSASAVTASGHRDLVGAAQRYAGTWARALRLAGVDSTGGRRTWTRERVIEGIRDLHRRRKSVMATDAPNAIKIAAQRLFGGWVKARSVALPGFEGPYEQWSKRKVVALLQQLHERGDSLTCDSVRAGENARLVNAAIRGFGSWDGALRAAIAGRTFRREWNERTIGVALRRRQREGRSLNASIVQQEDPALLNAARKHHGRWRRALEAAKVSTSGRREAWSAELVTVRLREVVQRHGRITAKLAGATLTTASQRYFGTFHAACVAAAVIP